MGLVEQTVSVLFGTRRLVAKYFVIECVSAAVDEDYADFRKLTRIERMAAYVHLKDQVMHLYRPIPNSVLRYVGRCIQENAPESAGIGTRQRDTVEKILKDAATDDVQAPHEGSYSMSLFKAEHIDPEQNPERRYVKCTKQKMAEIFNIG